VAKTRQTLNQEKAELVRAKREREEGKKKTAGNKRSTI